MTALFQMRKEKGQETKGLYKCCTRIVQVEISLVEVSRKLGILRLGSQLPRERTWASVAPPAPGDASSVSVTYLPALGKSPLNRTFSLHHFLQQSLLQLPNPQGAPSLAGCFNVSYNNNKSHGLDSYSFDSTAIICFSSAASASSISVVVIVECWYLRAKTLNQGIADCKLS